MYRALPTHLAFHHVHQQGRIGAARKQNGVYNAQVTLLEMQYLLILSKVHVEFQYVSWFAKFPTWLSPVVADGCGWTKAVCCSKKEIFFIIQQGFSKEEG